MMDLDELLACAERFAELEAAAASRGLTDTEGEEWMDLDRTASQREIELAAAVQALRGRAERERDEVERLRAALQRIAKYDDADCLLTEAHRTEIARAALAREPK